jgi:hypothetical protein
VSYSVLEKKDENMEGSELNAITFSFHIYMFFPAVRAGFKGELPGLSPRGLHKTEMEYADLNIFAALKSRA